MEFWVLGISRGERPVRAGLVPAQAMATTRVAAPTEASRKGDIKLFTTTESMIEYLF